MGLEVDKTTGWPGASVKDVSEQPGLHYGFSPGTNPRWCHLFSQFLQLCSNASFLGFYSFLASRSKTKKKKPNKKQNPIDTPNPLN